MVNAFHYDGSFSWPVGRRMAVMLTFDFQGGEDIRPKDGKIDHEKYTQAEYGPNTAIYRVSRLATGAPILPITAIPTRRCRCGKGCSTSCIWNPKSIPPTARSSFTPISQAGRVARLRSARSFST